MPRRVLRRQYLHKVVGPTRFGAPSVPPRRRLYAHWSRPDMRLADWARGGRRFRGGPRKSLRRLFGVI